MREILGKATLFGWAIFHVTLITLSASYIKIADWMPGKSIIDFYKKATGAGSSYGFFAPSIGVKSRIVFDLVDRDGKHIENIYLAPDSEREVQIRMGGIVEELTSKDAVDSGFRKPLAASLAAAIFARHGDALEVTLHVQEFWPTTMEEYRAGKRPDWSDYYAARFAKMTDHHGDMQ